MGFSLKKAVRKVVGKTGSKILGTTIDAVTGGSGSKIFLNGDSYLQDAAKKLTGKDVQELSASILGGLGGLGSGSGTDLGTILGNITGNGTIGNALAGVLGGINWGNSVFSAKQAKEMAKWNSELNYEYQTKLNQQGFAHDQEMLKMQQDYDTAMANTAVQRRADDLKAANINPIHAADLDASGGGLGGGSGLGGGTAQTYKADWLGLKLQQMAAERDAQRVKIEQANSASSGALMAAQEQRTMADMARTVAELPYVSRQKEAEINNIIAGTVKSKAESAKSIADTERIEKGIMATILGTKATNTKKIAAEIGLGLIPGIGVGMKAYKGLKAANQAKGFVNFLKATK